MRSQRVAVYVSRGPGGGLIARDTAGEYLTNAETFLDLSRNLARKLLHIHGFPCPFTLLVGPAPGRQTPPDTLRNLGDQGNRSAPSVSRAW